MVPFDATDAHARLDALAAKLEEGRAAVLVAEEGDPTALEALLAAVDAMAEDIAILRSAAGGPDLA